MHEVPSYMCCVPCVYKDSHRAGNQTNTLARRRDADSQPRWLSLQAMRNEQAEESLTPVAPQASMASVDELTALDANAEGEELCVYASIAPMQMCVWHPFRSQSPTVRPMVAYWSFCV